MPVACDHAGYALKSIVLQTIQEEGHEALDMGTFGLESVDFPDFAEEKPGKPSWMRRADRAVIMCGSGVGVSMTANKMKGVYASVCHDTYSAHQGVEHDHMNALCMGGRIIGEEVAREIVKAFLGASPMQTERQLRRVRKIKAVEEKN